MCLQIRFVRVELAPIPYFHTKVLSTFSLSRLSGSCLLFKIRYVSECWANKNKITDKRVNRRDFRNINISC